MRLFALLFAIYLACLSCLPCADEAPGCVEQAQTSIKAAAHSDGEHGGALGDWCSPLCQCHCCAGAVAPPGEAPAAVFAPAGRTWTAPQQHAPLLVAAPVQVARAVWQPPQA